MKILIINGPNLNLLGIRQPEIYGHATYADLVAFVAQVCADHKLEHEMFQSNHEGAIIDKIHAAYGTCDGIIINAGAYTHTSIAIMDALKAVNLPTVEVHLSDLSQREDFRQISYPAKACQLVVMGQGIAGYETAILALIASCCNNNV